MNFSHQLILVLTIILGNIYEVKSQSKEARLKITQQYNLQASAELSQKLENEFLENKAEAYRMAQLKGWPLSKSNADAVIQLLGITPEGAPLYYTTFNEGSILTSRANHLQPGGSLGFNLTGAAMEVGVWDGEYPRPTHVDFRNRFFSQDGVGPTANHPTHVLGTIIGAGQNNAAARGVAYEAIGWVNNFANDLTEMSQQSSFGLLVSNHSYGFVASGLPPYFFGAYTSKSKAVDDIIFTNKFYQPVVAAGNDGNGNPDLLTGMATAKNTIVVASVAQVNNYSGASSVNLAGSSSWGPTDDFRIKPDISSQGISVLSATSASDTSYGLLSGTSMATPGVSGVLILLQQHYFNRNAGNYMLSSTVRGLIAHTADEAGSFDGPDHKFGWGLINAKKSAELITKKDIQSLINQAILLPGTTFTKNVLALGNEPLIATLSWTDPSGPLSQSEVDDRTPVLINDLDIRITKGETTFLPWKLNSVTTGAIKGDNNVDNIEKIEINQPSGVYTISVTHKRDNLVNRAPGAFPSQEYSLIVSGIDAAAVLSNNRITKSKLDFWPNPTKDNININLPDSSEKSLLTIYDMQGREVVSNYALTPSLNNVPLNLTKGIYVVWVRNDSFSETNKLVIE